MCKKEAIWLSPKSSYEWGIITHLASNMKYGSTRRLTKMFYSTVLIWSYKNDHSKDRQMKRLEWEFQMCSTISHSLVYKNNEGSSHFLWFSHAAANFSLELLSIFSPFLLHKRCNYKLSTKIGEQIFSFFSFFLSFFFFLTARTPQWKKVNFSDQIIKQIGFLLMMTNNKNNWHQANLIHNFIRRIYMQTT